MAMMTPAMVAAIGTVIGAGASVYAATRKPKAPGEKPKAPVPDDEVTRMAMERERRRRALTEGRASTVLQGPGTNNVLG